MGSSKAVYCVALLACFSIGLNSLSKCHGFQAGVNQTAKLLVNASAAASKSIPETLFGIFFEEINHAGAGGLWAELVDNRGFEAGGRYTPSSIQPWCVIGDESAINVQTELSSCFESNKAALRMEVLCDDHAALPCPDGGVGIYNPGFWGMNIEDGEAYEVVLYVRSLEAINISVSLTSADGSKVLATSCLIADDVKNWTKMEAALRAKGSDSNSRLQLTTNRKGVIWFDQVSAMPTKTYKGHGFRTDLMEMLIKLEPRFIRFPGGCFVEGNFLRNAFRWKETVGPWEERPGHLGDVWMYWTDDGLGYLEFLQLAEDLGAAPVWVINNGISHNDEVSPSYIVPFVQEALDSIEFARGDADSKWGSIRAAMGHPDPFDLKYIAIGNEDCGKRNYRANYLKFHSAIKSAYPDIQIISNCEASSTCPLDHPADLYDYHIYTDPLQLFSLNHAFDEAPNSGPKAFVSEYAARGKSVGKGNLLASLAEAAFLLGVEKNSDHVAMASYAPLFVNANDRYWNPDAIVFNSSHVYGTPSYWMQHFFRRSSGAILHSSELQTNSSSLIATAISWDDPGEKETYTTIKVVNFGGDYVDLNVSVADLDEDIFGLVGSRTTVLTSEKVTDENSLDEPCKVVPVSSPLQLSGRSFSVEVQPYSFTSFDLLKVSSYIEISTSKNSVSKSSS